MIKPLTDVEATQARLGAMHPFKGLGEPEDIAKAALFLASDDASWVSGAALPVDGKSSLGCLVSICSKLTHPQVATLPSNPSYVPSLIYMR